VEADAMGLDLCDNFIIKESNSNEEMRVMFFYTVYYLFLCLGELEMRVSKRGLFYPRIEAVQQKILAKFPGGGTLLKAIDDEFNQRAKFYFDISAKLSGSN
jgi:hypothetical protein